MSIHKFAKGTAPQRTSQNAEEGTPSQADVLKGIGLDLLPIVGTYRAGKRFAENPNWRTGAEAVLSLAGDLTGVGGIVKAAKAAKGLKALHNAKLATSAATMGKRATSAEKAALTNSKYQKAAEARRLENIAQAESERGFRIAQNAKHKANISNALSKEAESLRNAAKASHNDLVRKGSGAARAFIPGRRAAAFGFLKGNQAGANLYNRGKRLEEEEERYGGGDFGGGRGGSSWGDEDTSTSQRGSSSRQTSPEVSQRRVESDIVAGATALKRTSEATSNSNTRRRGSGTRYRRNGQGPAAGYSVKKGDTISKIARDNGMTVDELMEANPHIWDKNRIWVGDKIDTRRKEERAPLQSRGVNPDDFKVKIDIPDQLVM